MNLRVGGSVGFKLLNALTRWAGPERWDPAIPGDPVRTGQARLERLFGSETCARLRDALVVEFGSGRGIEALGATGHGAAQVYGLEIRAGDIATATSTARQCGLSDRCVFINPTDEPERIRALSGTVDVVLSIDAFEHFADPNYILSEMYRLLRPGGSLLLSFGPPWNHPFGPHLGHFNRLPWLHFVFREETILKVRSRYCSDGATRLEDTGDGMNRMTIAQFEALVRGLPFEVVRYTLLPIKKLKILTQLKATREFFTSIIQAELRKPYEPDLSEIDVAAAVRNRENSTTI